MSSMARPFPSLCRKLNQITQLQRVSALCEWDQQVMMPSSDRTSGSRGDQLAAMAGITHEKSTSPALGAAIAECEQMPSSQLSAREAASVRDARIEFDKRANVSTELAERSAKVGNAAFNCWQKTKPSSDFEAFAPQLELAFNVTRELAEARRRPGQSLYDSCLQDYERGMTTDRLEEIFSHVKEVVSPMYRSVLAAEYQPDPAPLSGEFDRESQMEVTRDILEKLGFPLDTAGRIDVSAHPFSTSFSPHDLRITTRLRSDDWYQGLAGTIHEFGHSLYEGQLEDTGLPADSFLSMSVHESQSLFWERHIGLSEPFFECVGPLLRDKLGVRGSNRDIWEACNAVDKGNAIRVEADELAYPLHVILRYEMEKDVIEGQLSVKDIPALWESRMKDLLGVEVRNHAEGCMQDVHWASLAIGYFPTYLVGAIMAAQLSHHARMEIPDFDGLVKTGQFGPIRNWLGDKIHRHGSLHPSMDDLLQESFGERLNPSYFTDYLTEKFSRLYKTDQVGPNSRL